MLLMDNWKDRLYASYISTKQSATTVDMNSGLALSSYPQLEHVIRKHVPADKRIHIADLGCGHGALVFCLKAFGYENVEGVDVSSEQVSLAHRLGINEVRQGDLIGYIQNRNSTYDVLFLMDVLEHMTKQEVVDLLGMVRNALKDGGRLIIHVPNAEGIFGMRVRYGDFTHELCFTPQSIQQVLLASGFEDIAVYEDKPLVHGAKSLVRSLLWRLLTLRERLLLLAETGTAGHILSQNMLVVAKT
jgi:2-polyprenyl-3-methyl-5-hydroxy-6-metoxy-1,4-benzoquinol methylase